jgi:nucleotide-binding universal stress UspA family protein
MKTIIIPTDFSKNGADAFNYALHLVDEGETLLHIISIIPPLPQTGEVGVVLTDYDTQQTKRVQADLDTLEMFAKDFFKDKGNIKISTRAILGPVSPLIKQEAARLDADLIVMGSRGENHSFLDKFAGTVSLGVLDGATCPVVLVPNGYKFQDLKRIMFATALDHADPFELWRAQDLLELDDAVCHCLHIVPMANSNTRKSLRQFEEFFESNKNGIETEFFIQEHENIEHAIVEFAERQEHQLIILTKSKRSLWQKLFGKSHTKKLASMNSIPMLVMNEQTA